MHKDSEFFERLGASVKVQSESSKPLQIDLSNLFGPEEITPVSKRGVVRTTERTRPETISKIASDVKSISRLITEHHDAHVADIDSTKTELEKKIEAQQTDLLRDELSKLTKAFTEYVRTAKNRVETRIDYRETERLDKDLKSVMRSLDALKKAPAPKPGKIEIRLDDKEVKSIHEELKRLKKLVGEVGKYEYGSSLNILKNSVPIGFTGLINFKNGTGTIANVSLNKAGGIDVEIDATGGTGGLNYLAATGTVNDSNKVFTFASAPTLVAVNGFTYRNGFGVTISGATATLDNAPGVGGDVYGLG